MKRARPNQSQHIYSPAEPRGVLAWLQRPSVALASLLFLALNAAMVQCGHLLPTSLARFNLQPALTSFARELNEVQWPSVGQWYIVDDPSSPRFVPTDSGSFEDWELPFTSRLVRIYSVNTALQPRVRGWWSPVALQLEYEVRIRILVRGHDSQHSSEQKPGDPGSDGQASVDRAFALFVTNMKSLEGEQKALQTLKPAHAHDSQLRNEHVWRSTPRRSLQWFGLLNDAAVLLAGVLAVISLTGWRTWKQRRVARTLRAQKCPGCGYGLAGLRVGTCPECGAQFINDQSA